MKEEVNRFVERCKICQIEKGVNQTPRLYMSLPILKMTWEHIYIDFILGLPRTQRQFDVLFTVVDRFSNMAHFMSCKKTSDVTYCIELFFKEVLQFYGWLKMITSNKDTRFLSHFSRILWKKMTTKLQHYLSYHPHTNGQTDVLEIY
jgi:hypothetical protein